MEPTPELTPDLAAAVAVDVLGAAGREVVPLRGSDRALVARVALEGREPVIVKLHRPADGSTTLVREPAALEVVGLPQLLGVSTSPPGIIMRDLGSGDSLAEALLGNDPGLARERVLEWSRCLARSQVPGAGYAAALASHADRFGLPVPGIDGTTAMLSAAAEALAEMLPGLGVNPTAHALEELRSLDGMLGGDVRRLTPTDTCPDNCIWVDDRFVLIDYESAQVRHVAWDVAYFRVPFPSCWCSWALPEDLAREALATWKQSFGDPYVATDRFEQDLRAATLGWAFITCWWFLRRAEVERGAPAEHQPSARARLLHRFAEAPSVEGAPALTDLASQVHSALAGLWGTVPLELAPAFRSLG